MSLGVLWAILNRHRWFMAVWVLLIVGISAFFIFNLQPRYRATALVTLDTRPIRFAEVSAPVSQLSAPMDASLVRTEVELLGSDSIARQVVGDLHLVDSPEFRSSPSLFEQAMIAIGLRPSESDAPPKPEEIFERTVATYRGRLGVFTDGRSYVISVSFEASDRQLAARIANRHVEAYIRRQREMKDQALANATSWLDREVASLSERVRQWTQAIQTYREDHRLFNVDAARGSNSVAQQQLAEALVELTRARADLVARQARLQQARDPARSMSIPEIVTSPVIARMREQELTARQRLAEVAGMSGPNHPFAVPLREEIAETRRQIDAERTAILRSIASEATIAQTREAELSQLVSNLESRLAQSERDSAGLRDLEREASATRSLYESLLARQKQVATQVGIQQADAQLSSRAVPPQLPSFPNKKLFLAVSFIVAAGTGSVLSLLLDGRRKGFGTIEETEAAIGLPVLAALPRSPRGPLALANQVAYEPGSLAAEAVQRLRSMLAMRQGGLPAVLSVTSALPGEGKTSVALALGRSLASSGFRVLLIEADLRQGKLAATLFRHRIKFGTSDVLTDRVGLEQAVQLDPVSSLHILAAKGDAVVPQDLLTPARLQPVLSAARARYDHVILETAPFNAVADAIIVGRSVDETLLVVRAETTPAAAVTSLIRSFRGAHLPIAGLVLNAADPRHAGLIGYPRQVPRLSHSRT
jgi:capsular exopolysaccharide synthesis family protein